MRNIRTIRKKQSSDRYLITYADLLSLLLGLFVILYTSSQLNAERFKAITEAFENTFQKVGRMPLIVGGDGVLDGTKNIIPEPIIPNFKNGNLDIIESELKMRLQDFIFKSNIEIFNDGKLLKIAMPERLLFQSGKAEIQSSGAVFLDTLTTLLIGLPNQIMIDGHTDNVPINNFLYKSNWHLSSMRAANVCYKMVENGLQKTNLTIRGFGEQRPLESNLTIEGKARNRRVEVSISKMDTETPTSNGFSSDSL